MIKEIEAVLAIIAMVLTLMPVAMFGATATTPTADQAVSKQP
jgi:hypothetical protein